MNKINLYLKINAKNGWDVYIEALLYIKISFLLEVSLSFLYGFYATKSTRSSVKSFLKI